MFKFCLCFPTTLHFYSVSSPSASLPITFAASTPRSPLPVSRFVSLVFSTPARKSIYQDFQRILGSIVITFSFFFCTVEKHKESTVYPAFLSSFFPLVGCSNAKCKDRRPFLC